jgi:hypothetical protein
VYIIDHSHLDYFSHSINEMSRRESVKECPTIKDISRPIEHTYLVLTFNSIDTYFTSNGTIHHSQKSSWNIDPLNTSFVSTTTISTHISYHSSSHTYHYILSTHLLLKQSLLYHINIPLILFSFPFS